MPYSNNSGGPWGGGGSSGGGGGGGPWGGGGGGDDDDRGRRRPQKPVSDLDDLFNKGRERLTGLMGGGGGGGGNGSGPGGFGKGGIALVVLAGFVMWALASFYTVRPEEQSVELFLGKYSQTGDPGLNFAPWPLVTYEVLPVRRENVASIGTGVASRDDSGLMLTGDENIVDIDFQVFWNISDPAKFLFNLRDPEETISAVAESAMREVIGRSELAPILNRDRGIISAEVQELIGATLDSYDSGVNVIRLTLDKADPPAEVIDSFRDVQKAEQERNTFQNQADAYANQRLAQARGEAAQLLQEAEGYRAQVVNEAQGEASRFVAVYDEYAKAEDVTRKRLYLETLERVLGSVDKIVIDESATGQGQGVVPYLPLNELRRTQPSTDAGAGQ
jgi:modulator of FtsH protease HflK